MVGLISEVLIEWVFRLRFYRDESMQKVLADGDKLTAIHKLIHRGSKLP